MIGHHAMILAAGFGKRMRPLTDTLPKPLIPVAGKPLLAYALDAARNAGVSRVVVNVHYRAEQIEAWCAEVQSPAIAISDERDALLETGGGIAKALPLLGRDPFFVLNGDGFWTEFETSALVRLRDAWRDDDMDCLLLLSPLSRTTGYDARGDFLMDNNDRLSRLPAASPDAMAYIGGYLVHPRLFEGVAVEKFSMNRLWDKAIAQGRLFGLAHAGWWFHVGTPEAIALAETGLRRLTHGP
jgi:N-acetyl-alpha-D-muramate 1-phosphate uridylyltransferase